MQGTRLSGRRRMDEIYEHADVNDGPGVYVFYQTCDGPPRYVGRTINLRQRLRHSNRGFRDRGYTYYAFKQCSSDYDAFKWECRYWHEHQEDLDNVNSNGGNHPARPGNHRCPVCD